MGEASAGPLGTTATGLINDVTNLEELTTGSVMASAAPVLSPADIAVIIGYFAVVLAVGLWATFTSSRKSVKGYFLAGRNMAWLPVGASVFASNIGTAHFIGLAGTGAVSGTAVALFEWVAVYLILLLGWFFLPIYIASGVYTMPEYLYKRYGGQRLRITTSVISMFLYVTTKIAADLYSGALFIQLSLGINLYLAIVSLLVVTAIYTVLGGLKAVMYTDTIQTVIMFFGGLLIMIMSFIEIGGYAALEEKYMSAVPQTTIASLGSENSTTCGMPREDAFHAFRDPVNSDIPWPGLFLAMFTMGPWYWCTDQVIVQRTLAAKTIQDAKGGCIIAGLLKITPMYFLVMTGMVSRVMFTDEVACAEPSECERICQNPEGCSNLAFPKLVLKVLPQGLRGIMVAAMLSALMSSLTSVFNSTSTIFTIDIWKRMRKRATEKEQLIVGKVTVVLLVIVAIVWIPILESSAGGQLFIYINIVISALGPPLFALFLYGILWTRTNEKGAFWGLVVGSVAGLVRLVLEFYYKAPACGEPEERPPIVYKVNYLYIAPIIFVTSSVVIVSVSYLTEPPRLNQLHGTTWKYISEKQSEKITPGENVPDERVDMESPDDNSDHKSSRKEDEEQYRLSNLYEDPRWAFRLNILAVGLMLVMAFLMGVYF